MQDTLTLYQSTIGKKTVVAVTGVILVGFVLGHLLGNLQVYAGPETLNAYGEFLHSKPGLLWGTRLVLFISVIAHIYTSIKLAARNQDARPQAYKKKRDVVTNYAARTMVMSGPLLALFIVYHLMHLTLGFTPGYEHSETDVYANVINGFSVWYISAVYIVAMLALGYHLFHGIWSLFQTLGLNHPRYNAWRKKLALAITLFVTAGNISIPVSVMTGILT